jgi:chromosome partitioning protein
MGLFKRASRHEKEIEAIEAALAEGGNGSAAAAAPPPPPKGEPQAAPPPAAEPAVPGEATPNDSAPTESAPAEPATGEATPTQSAAPPPPASNPAPSEPEAEATPSREAARPAPSPTVRRPRENGNKWIGVRRPSPPPEAQEEEPARITAEEALAPSRPPALAPGAPGEDPSKALVYAFANQKGGVAKTTTTLNLAVAFREAGHRVLAIDLDPQGNLTMSQGIDPDKSDKSMYDVLVNRLPISEVIQHREIDIAVASIDLAGAEIAMSTMIGRERSLEKALSEVSGDYDFVCIDTPPSLGLLTVNALTAADKVIVPVQCEYLSMRGLVQLQNTLEMIRENLNPRIEIEGILPTMLDARTVHAKEAVEILEENFGELVFKSRIRKAIKFAEAPVRGSSVLKYDPNGNAAEYYRELAKEVLTNGAS